MMWGSTIYVPSSTREGQIAQILMMEAHTEYR
jgi:hypothetical protein